MKRLAIIALALSLLGCGATIRAITGEGTPHCRLACAWDETCRWEWVECSSFGFTCSHSEKPECRKSPGVAR